MTTQSAQDTPVPHSSQPHRDEWDPQPPSNDAPGTPAHLQTFLTLAQKLANSIDTTTGHPQAAGDPIPKAMLSQLLGRLKEQPEANQPALFGWLLLRATYSATRARELFDELELRNGLAQTFAAFNLHGEQGWRAAVQVRLLLETDLAPLDRTVASPGFWSNPDVRWLAGVDSTGHYLNKESFEALLPLLAYPTQSAGQPAILKSIQQAAYKITSLTTPATTASSSS